MVAYLTDLGLLGRRYAPGDILIFRSKALYHGVSHWRPLGIAKNREVTPGRVSHVYFSHSSVFDILKDKPSGWNLNTMGGSLPGRSDKI